MRLPTGLVLLALLAVGCGLLPEVEPVAQPDPAVDVVPEIVEPPALAINGVRGRPVSWCWGARAWTDSFMPQRLRPRSPRLSRSSCPQAVESRA